MKDIRQKLFAIFQAEHAQHLEQIRSILGLLESVSETDARGMIDEAFRRAHSLKGAARAVDLRKVEELASEMESVFAQVRDGSLRAGKDVRQAIYRALDSSEECVAAFQLPASESAPPEQQPALPQASQATSPAPRVEMVRVPGEDLDRLVRSTGRILTESARQKTVLSQMTALGQQIAEMEAECDRFRNLNATSLRHLAGDAENVPIARYIETVEKRVRALAGQARKVRFQQQRSTWTSAASAEVLKQDVLSARMVPAGDVFEGFRKMVRDLARDEKKEIEFHLSGSGVRADRAVLQTIKDPVMHLLRNAISHGIEAPRARELQGKPPLGHLTLRVEAGRGRLAVEVDDDGRGVDLQTVAKSAVARRILSPSEAEASTPAELGQILFRAGFSTALAVNDLSGRGMGLSVVQEIVRCLQGEVSLIPKAGPGACFAFSVPLSVSSCHLVLVRSQGQTFGIPSHGIERLCRVPADRVETMEGKPVVSIAGRRISLFRLSQLLRMDETNRPSETGILKVVVLRSGTRTEAVLVDEFVGDKDALIQDLGFPCPSLENIIGGVLLGDGVVLVALNPARLVDNCTQSNTVPLQSVKLATPVLAPKILVVDDSITARSLERNILEANGFRVCVAVDGMEGLQSAREQKPDLIVSDLQMPRLDGFGLLQALKADPELNHIPVIIVSSVESTEEQRRGLVLGADAYVVKRKFDEQELLDTIRQIL